MKTFPRINNAGFLKTSKNRDYSAMVGKSFSVEESTLNKLYEVKQIKNFISKTICLFFSCLMLACTLSCFRVNVGVVFPVD